MLFVESHVKVEGRMKCFDFVYEKIAPTDNISYLSLVNALKTKVPLRIFQHHRFYPRSFFGFFP